MAFESGATIKTLGFDGGVTLQGGLAVVIATPAHDIAGEDIAGVTSSQNALDIVIEIASRRAGEATQDGVAVGKEKSRGILDRQRQAKGETVVIPACCQ